MRHDGSPRDTLTEPMTSADVVARLYACYQRRDWAGAAAVLHPDAFLSMPATGETLDGRDRIVQLQREYPEPWGELTVQRVVGTDPVVAAEIVIDAPDARYRCAAFWTVADGLAEGGTEYWVTEGGERPDPARRPRPST